MTAELDRAIDRLYATFDPYRIHHDMDHCDHCVAKEEIRDLLSKHVRGLTSEDLEDYAFKAVTTWGSVEDFKHFLPRLFELVATDRDFGVDVEVVLSKLSHAQWTRWPDDEGQAVRGFLQDLWTKVLTSTDPAIEPGRVLCGIGRAEPNLGRYLDTWAGLDSPVAAKHLAQFVDENLPVILKKGKLNNAFWDGQTDQVKQVREWLSGSRTRRRLEELALLHAGTVLGDELMSAVERLEHLH